MNAKRRIKSEVEQHKSRDRAANDNPEDPDLHWYVVQAKTRGHLDGLECDIEDCGIPAYVPRRNRKVRAGRKKRLDRTPILGPYVFVLLNLKTGEVWKRIFRMPGFGGMLCDEETSRPLQLTALEMTAIRLYAAPDWHRRQQVKTYVQGAKVRVKTGPFADSVGEIEKIVGKMQDVDAEQRIRIAIPAFGGTARFIAEASEIELI
jgi:transcription antitermination factor NusG